MTSRMVMYMEELRKIANKLRKELIVMHSKANLPHIGSNLSCLDILITLYCGIITKKDHFILSKGHSALALYAVLHQQGIISDKIYQTLGEDGSPLAEHPVYGLNGVEVATGSLGHGLPIAAGMALSKKFDKESGRIYVLLSDGECQEGSTLEAMNFVVRLELYNVTAIIDDNKWQAYDRTLLDIEKVKNEFLSAGWSIKEVDGHDFEELYSALKSPAQKPTLIIAHTVLGKGVPEMEDKLLWHYKPPSKDQANDFISVIP